MKNWKKICGLMAALAMSTGLFCACGGETEVKDLANYVQSIEEITLPEEVRIVALGEATHGNKEFQELKLDVFAHLVETTDVRGFALEGDFSGCAIANNYIVHNEGSVEEAVKKLGFEIYRTDEMLELVQWMHDYNQTAAEDNKVRFYGFDMQRDMFGIQLVKTFYNRVDAGKAENFGSRLDGYYGETERAFQKSDLPAMEKLVGEIIADMEANATTYQGASDEESYAYALQAAKCLQQNLAIHVGKENYGTLRDRNMTENVKWILDREERIHGSKLMLAGHNGHITKEVSTPYVNMGNHLYKEFGNAYFAIGTDFYNTTCNIASGAGREDFQVCSDNLLAKAIGDMENNLYYLDFTKASQSEELQKVLNNPMLTGSLGENFSATMKLMKSSYQLNMAPAKLYDAMILVYEATPIRVWDYIK